MSWLKSIPKSTLIVSGLIFTVTFIVYLLTLAPSVTFWDCGELIACSYILGIPHPPGSPLYILIGRLFTLLPIGDLVAFRTNLASALFASLTSVIAFLLVLRLCSNWKMPVWIRLAAGLVGAFCLAFSNTFWSNATESEVYAFSMFLMLLLLYVTLFWMDHYQTDKGDRLLAFIAYTGLLSTAVHMITYLVMPVIFLLVIWHAPEKLKDLKIWITGLLLSLVMLTPTIPTEFFLLGLTAWLLIACWGVFRSSFSAQWILVLAIAALALVGYSGQLYIPIRSVHNPAIDENDPQTWKKFKSFLERRQYGQIGMIERSFSRRGRLTNQLGTYEHIGWWGFFRDQFSDRRVWFIPVVLGILGLIKLIRHRPREGISLLLMLLIATLGLVWYMNFGDGTVPNERLEVRDRDYFFLPGFALFALAIGLGAAALLDQLTKRLGKATPGLAKPYGYATASLFLLLPSLALAHNYQRNDRSHNWICHDFAYNLLISCDQDAILFTNGDNDTFPLWFLQSVEKVRPDVRVINFSLLNTYWYILQQKDKYNVPLTLSDDQINSLQHYLKQGRLIRVQDQMLEHILDANSWKFPINFATTVSPENRIYNDRSLENYLVMDGLIYRLVPHQGKQMVDVEGMQDKLFNKFRHRGVTDATIWLDETSRRMLTNYLPSYFNLADTLSRAGRYDEALALGWKSRYFAPGEWKVYALLAQLYTKAGRPAEAENVVQSAPSEIERERLYFNIGYTYKLIGVQEEYEKTMHKTLQLFPHFQAAYQELFSTYYTQKRRLDLVELVDSWTKNNPQDRQALSLLQSFKNPAFDFPDTTAVRQALQR